MHDETTKRVDVSPPLNASECVASKETLNSPTALLSAHPEGAGNRRFPWVYTGLIGSLLLRFSLFNFESGDYRAFLSNWYDYFVEHGRWNALKDDFSSYPPLYLYLISLSTLVPLPKLYVIKLFSIVGDYVAAWFIFKIVRHQFPRGPLPWVAALGLLFLPSVWLNSSMWGQCDAMFTSALLGALYYVLVKQPGAAMVAIGLAAALKPQAIFLVPFLAGIFFRERWSWRLVAIPPLVYTVCGLPAMLAGKPVSHLFFHWGRQQNIPELTLGATNWYQWISNDYYEIFFVPGVVLTLVATVFLILAMQERFLPQPLTRAFSMNQWEHPTPESRASGAARGDDGTRAIWLSTTALLSVLIAPYLLPGMHERYFYPADLFSLVFAFFVRRGWMVAALVQFCSFFTYLPYLFTNEPVPRPMLAVLMTVTLGMVIVGFAKTLIQPTTAGHEGKRTDN